MVTTLASCTGPSFSVNLYSYDLQSTLVSPAITGTNGGQVTFSFKYKVVDYYVPTQGIPAADIGTITLQWSQSTSGPWTSFGIVNSSNHLTSGTCATKTFTASGIPSVGNVYFRIVPLAPSTINGDGYLYYYDDIAISQGAAPSCPTPGNLSTSAITGTSATISWSVASTSNGFQYYYNTTGTAPTAATPPWGTTAAGVTTATINNLTPITPYYFWVRANCGTVQGS
jgi:hypothetical protein